MSNKHHNSGQKDGASGNYNPPHGHGKEFVSFGKELKRVHKENQSYRKGHRNGSK